ncbi:MAG TPA: FG-GAP-like repeat-containing protein [Blastocatellia bacterium]|nr:FG-GAP-like repeat-containing protein [Blastocatellia bacterium]HNG33771.1 FG-GAP-like repeat-containing protein [Blastocatellia bacterium]
MPLSQTFPAQGGTGTIALTATVGDPQTCSWMARSNVSWIRIISSASGSGNGIVTYFVEPTTSARSGTLVISGHTFSVSQEVNPCLVPALNTQRKTQEIYVISSNSTDFADFNGDGFIDFVTNYGSSAFRIGFGDGAGRFNQLETYSANYPISFEIADLNQDGRLDIAFYELESQSIAIMLNKADRVFTLSQRIPASYFLSIQDRERKFHIRDFNSDGKPDLLFNAAPFSRQFLIDAVILAGNGDGTFTKTLSRLSYDLANRLFEAGDYNGDGNLDLAAWTEVGQFSDSKDIAIWLGNGQGSFMETTHLNLTNYVQQLEAADLNGDGYTDLVAYNGRTISVVLAKPAGGFSSEDIYPVLGGFGILVEDVTGDGKPDILTKSFISILVNTGNGKLSELPDFTEHGSLALGDVNGDGTNDMILYERGAITTIFNHARCIGLNSVAVTSVTGDSGARAAIDSMAMIKGNSLSNSNREALDLPLPTELGGAKVTIKDSKDREFLAPLFFVSPYQIYFMVTADLALGTAVVSVIRPDASIARGTFEVTRIAPKVFSTDGNLAQATVLRVKADGTQVYEPVQRYDPGLEKLVAVPVDVSNSVEQVYLILYGTGFRYRTGLSEVVARLDEIETPVLFAGPLEGFVGSDQCNIRLPSSLAGRGNVEIFLLVEGKASNTVKIQIK